MKTNYIPAIVMLFAGAVYCLFGIYSGVALYDFTVQLLIVLFVFYILGGIIKMVLDHFMGEIGDKTETKEETESTEEEPEKNTETSEEGM